MTFQSETSCFHSETVITERHRELIESFVMWHCNNPLKLNINKSDELVMDGRWMSVTS